MCGIAGIVRFDDRPLERGRLEAMRDQLRHRGPDGQGISLHDRCGFAHVRLSIIDLLSGQQPMHLPPEAKDPRFTGFGDRTQSVSLRDPSGGGPLHLVFNGEIYNHVALRRQLERKGHRFHSDHSDTEVLLYGYRQWGDNLPKHLHGMFAFAIWDERNRRLFVARDRAGKKPFYYRFDRQYREMVFGSLTATVLAGLAPEERGQVNRAALLRYLRLGYTFAPSLVEGVQELPAANTMLVEADGQIYIDRYWQPPPISKHSTSLGAADALDEVLSEAVDKRLEADVPLGCFLSGGIDSSVVAAMAQRKLTREKAGALRTYSVSMPDVLYDETPHAQRVADHLGAEHTVLPCEVGDAIADLERLMAVSGDPTADSSLLATHWLCKTARPHCKAALSGDGGDELFGGYDRYRAMRLLSQNRGWLAALPGSVFRGGHPKSRRARFGRLIAAAKSGRTPDFQYQSMIHLFDEPQIGRLVPGLLDYSLSDTLGVALPNWPPWDDLAHAAMRWDFEHYLPYELLRKVDRASMAVALEVRCPMLDTQVCDLAGHLPTAVLMPRGRPKGLLREVAARYLPTRIVNRPKMGFAVPMGDWLRGHLRDPLHERLHDGGLESLGLDPGELTRYFDEHQAGRADHTHRLFGLLQLSLWMTWRNTQPLPTAAVGI
jgi:asparagine synthase (glutamine-hydrolysing)